MSTGSKNKRRERSASCAGYLQSARLPIVERASKLQRLEQKILCLLPTDLAAHCKVMNLKKELLVLYTTSPAWAARLRFITPELTKQLRCQLSLDVRTIKIRVQQPEDRKDQPARRSPQKISMKNADLLAKTAKGVGDPALQEALYRLAAKASEF